MTYKFQLQNLKCGGCANTITKGALSVNGISDVNVNDEDSSISFSAVSDDAITQLIEKLASLGYPISGEDNSTIQKAKSYVSCMIGRIS